MVLRFAVSAVDSELVLDVMLPAHLEGLTDMHAFMRILHEEPPSTLKENAPSVPQVLSSMSQALWVCGLWLWGLVADTR